jgi:hypothetical protein
MDFFSVFREAGWHTSYYLPTRLTLDYLKNKETKKLEQLGADIALQISTQKTSAVSFNKSLYPFVEDYLEQHIDKATAYHTWLTYPLSDPDLIKKISGDEIHLNKRFKTILTKFKSSYEL